MLLSTVCRVCLVSNVRMHKMEKKNLLKIYQKLTNTKINSEDGSIVCYICYSQLLKCYKFTAMALKSNRILKAQLMDDIHTAKPCPILNLSTVDNNPTTISPIFMENILQKEPDGSNLTNVNVSDVIPVKIEIKVKNENVDVREIIKTEAEAHDIDDELSNIELLTNQKSFIKNYLHCHVCDKNFSSKLKLANHNSTIHKGEKLYTCVKCEKQFYMIHYLKKHVEDCEGKTCRVCSKTFINTSYLKKHMKTHTEDKPYICDRCCGKFKTKTQLKSHMIIHSGEKPYSCELCGKSFNQSSNLKTHMKIHSGTKPFACEICGKAFLTNGTLKTHMKCHTKERPFKCNTCGMTFGFKCSLNEHVRRLHIEVKPFPCNKCSLSFNHEMSLTAHLRSHSAERVYSCDRCTKTFTSARNLKGHMQVHSAMRPYSCNRCGRAFKRPEHLRQHDKTSKCRAAVD